MIEEEVKFVSPAEAVMESGSPIRVWKSGGGTKTIDDFISGKVLEATDNVLSYQNSRGDVYTFKISEGDKFEVLPPSAAT